MKKTLTINLSGTVFHVDEDAYDILNQYLKRVNAHFGNDTDAREIVEDIESRINELFTERLKQNGDVVTVEIVNEIIAIMGSPEAFDEQNEPSKEGPTATGYSRSRARRLYRDPEEKVLGGVCSGIGAYFALDPVLIRLIFVLLVVLGLGSSIIVYLVMWIAVPKAVTPAQRLEMKGEEVNVNSLSKTIKEDIRDVKENIGKIRNGKGGTNQSSFGTVIGDIVRAFLRIGLIIFGIVILVVAIVFLISLITTHLLFDQVFGFHLFGQGFPGYFSLFAGSGSITWLYIGGFIALLVPVIMLIYWGSKLIFRFKSKGPIVGITAFSVWILGIIIMIFGAIHLAGNFRSQSTTSRQEILTVPNDTLVISSSKDEFAEAYDESFKMDRLRVASVNGDHFLINRPRVKIVKSETAEYSMNIKVKSRGKDVDMAQQNAKEINYQFDQKGSNLSLDPWFRIPKQTAWRFQQVDLTIRVPLNKVVYLDQSVVELLNDIRNTSDMWDGDMGGKYWMMKTDGLEVVQKAQPKTEITKKGKK